MARSVSLSAYLALARRAPPSSWEPPQQARPEGPLIWLHAGAASALPALLQLADRFAGLGGDAQFLLTIGGEGPPPEVKAPNIIVAELPPENIAAAEMFLAHWHPDLVLWSTGHLRPALLVSAARMGQVLWLIGVDETALEEGRWRWLPDMSRGVVGVFARAFANSANAARRLQRLGLPAARVEVTGPLQTAAAALPCDEEERARLAAEIAGRSVWLAARVHLAEVDTILAAHRRVSRSTHRLLLILVPAEQADNDAIAQRVLAEGWRVAQVAAGEVPGEGSQILLADSAEEMGMWFRLSPIAFMGSSLLPDLAGCDPWAPAALGAAILSGPNTGVYQPDYTRLAEAGAARIVQDADTLANAVSRLTAPDQAAAMAHAAWTLATDGAEATDILLEQIDARLDEIGFG
ncbi:glycosyltransferase N-terminal domain-containing protein [Pseudooceanicola sp.]|uniref:3-deoxy-D-manno-octulosonic acid transferase n=1 Tax=Pseudooceanicola sp. TaxID=1914328 RepID=UPI00262EFB10|nr:glycosyltransferase N-terminal domain-containing protein [Pseudooceanicola sp.]MDF1856055.1 glycosyltransferase N-terminal domain-containing protein [Pseudooceanicola sp.]